MTLLLVGDSLNNPNLYYKTGFLASDPFVYVENEQRRALIITPFEVQRARNESSVPEVLSFDEFGYWDLVRELGDRSEAWADTVARIAHEFGGEARIEGNFPVYLADALRSRDVRLEVDPQLLVEQRRQKSREEIEAIADSQRAGQKAIAQAIEILRQADIHLGTLHYNGIPLTAERLRTEIELLLTREGFEPHGPLVAPGPGAADPHWKGSGPIRAGDAIIFDIFPRSSATRYFGDCTRTVVRGEPREELVAMYAAVLKAQEAALKEIRAGANGKSAHEAVLDVFTEAGFNRESGPRFTHGTGHGVGLGLHESPGLSILDVELLEGDVVTVEPGLYDPQIGGVRIEDLVVVTRGGYENLTQLPKQLEV